MRWLVTRDGVVETPARDLLEETVAAPREDVYWVDLQDPDGDDLTILREVFGFPLHAVESISRPLERPHIEEFDSLNLLTLFAADWDGAASRLRLRKIEVFLSKHFIVTAHATSEAGFGDVRRRVRENPKIAGEKPAYLQYLVLAQIVDPLSAVLDDVEASITGLERQIVVRPTRRGMGRVYDLKQVATDLGKYTGAQREVVEHLITHAIDPAEQHMLMYYKDIHATLVRQHETADELRDLCGGVMEVYMSGASNRLNEQMKQLTLLAALFLPITAITGFFGMNHAWLVDHINGLNPFLATIVAMALVESVLLMVFWRRGWL